MEGKLGKFDVFMMLICGLMFTDVITSNASCGAPAVTWWVILGILYMIPMGMIIGELSGAYPGEGGIYVWIYEGLGPKWATLTGWIFFCCGLFIPVSSFVMCSDILFELFAPDVSFVIRVAVAIALVWIMAGVSTMRMADSKGIVNIAGLIKLSIFVLAFVAGIVYIAQGNAVANDLSLSALSPTLGQGLTFLPVIVYCCTGMELASASAEQLNEPSTMLPKVITGVAILAVVLNIISCLGVLMVVPIDTLDLDLGLLNMFMTAFHSSALYYIIGICFIFAVIAQCVTWAVGGNRGACESAKIGDLPAFLGKETKGGQPVGAILTTTIVSTVLLILYAFVADSASDLFFSLLSCGVIGSLLPYTFMIVAYQKMKKRNQMDFYHGFKVKGGVVLSWIVQIIQVATLCLMIYIPGQGWNESVLTNVFGAVIMIASGLIVYRYMNNKKNKNTAEPEAATAAAGEIEK